MNFIFRKAERTKVRLKVMVNGPSGSGKTMGALGLASRLGLGQVAAIDSENDRMLYYAEQFDFAHLSLSAIGSVKPADYMKALDAAVTAGFQVVVIDSLHHAWQDVLDRKEAYDRQNPTTNGFANWKRFGKEWEALIRHILEAPVHVIATSRSKQEYQLVEQDGKKKVAKLGVNPTVREGTEYEFALVFDVMPSHIAHCTKDNTGLFGTDPDTDWDLNGPKVAADIVKWMGGATAEERPRAVTYDGPRFVKMKGLEKYADVPLPELPQDVLEEGAKRARALEIDKPESEGVRLVREQLDGELERRSLASFDVTAGA